MHRLGRGFAEFFHRPAQAGHGFPDGNQAVPFTLQGLFSHAPQLPITGRYTRGGLVARSRVMQKIRGHDTQPELAVCSYLHRAGLRYRLHARDLPGCPEVSSRRVCPRMLLAPTP